jgi:hypothetical protein
MDEILNEMQWHAGKRVTIDLFMGDVEIDVTASREELKYTERTKTAIKKCMAALHEEIIQSTESTWQRKDITQWERRLLLQKFEGLGASLEHVHVRNGLPKDGRVSLDGLIKDFHVKTDSFVPSTKVVIIIRDDRRTLKGFEIPGYFGQRKDYPYLLVPIKTDKRAKLDSAKLLRKVEDYFASQNAAGIPIKLLSSLTFNAQRASRSGRNLKHVKREFAYRHFTYQPKAIKASQYWEIVEFTPHKDDVFVILEHFEVRGLGSWKEVFKQDIELAKLAGVKFPQIKGYKSTVKRPVDISKIVGIPYNEWQKTFHAKAFGCEPIRSMARLNLYKQKLDLFTRKSFSDSKYLLKCFDEITKHFKASHPLASFFAEAIALTKRFESARADVTLVDAVLVYTKEYQDWSIEKTFKSLIERYSLLPLIYFDSMRSSEKIVTELVKYIKFVDFYEAKSKS